LLVPNNKSRGIFLRKIEIVAHQFLPEDHLPNRQGWSIFFSLPKKCSCKLTKMVCNVLPK
jgi:hypothetical protein